MIPAALDSGGVMIPAIATGVMIPARRTYLLAAIPAIIPTQLG